MNFHFGQKIGLIAILTIVAPLVHGATPAELKQWDTIVARIKANSDAADPLAYHYTMVDEMDSAVMDGPASTSAGKKINTTSVTFQRDGAESYQVIELNRAENDKPPVVTIVQCARNKDYAWSRTSGANRPVMATTEKFDRIPFIQLPTACLSVLDVGKIDQLLKAGSWELESLMPGQFGQFACLRSSFLVKSTGSRLFMWFSTEHNFAQVGLEDRDKDGNIANTACVTDLIQFDAGGGNIFYLPIKGKRESFARKVPFWTTTVTVDPTTIRFGIHPDPAVFSLLITEHEEIMDLDRNKLSKGKFRNFELARLPAAPG